MKFGPDQHDPPPFYANYMARWEQKSWWEFLYRMYLEWKAVRKAKKACKNDEEGYKPGFLLK